jgi:hypothetical protein
MMARKTSREADPVDHRSVVVASFDLLRAIARDKTGMAFVWPDEGSFEEVACPDEQTVAVWRFNQQHEGFEPLWIDPTTASLLLRLHDALSRVEVQERLRERVGRDRGTFGQIVELCWSAARPPAAAAGG